MIGNALNAPADETRGGYDDISSVVADTLASLPASISPMDESEMLVTRLESDKRKKVSGETFGKVWVVARAGLYERSEFNAIVQLQEDSEPVILFLNRIIQGITLRIHGGGGRLMIGAGKRPLRGAIGVGLESRIEIGDLVSAQKIQIVTNRSEALIGRDCLISTNVLLHTASRHGIIDLNKSPYEARPVKTKLELGDHVWLGHSTTLLGSSKVGNGSIVGAGSVVASHFPDNCVIVGNPAQMKREDVTWSREPNSIDENTMAYLNDLNSDPDSLSGSENMNPMR